MAVQILGLSPAEQYKATAGQELGTALGQGLQMLAQQKLQDVMQQRQKASALQGLQAIGFNPQEAQQLSGLDPMIQREIVKQKIAAPQQQAYAQALQGLLGGPSEQQMISEQIQTPEGELKETYTDSVGETREKPPAGSPKGSIIPAGLTQQQATELAKLGIQQKQLEEKLTREEQKEIRKEVVPFIKDIQSKARAAQENNMRLDKMEQLIESGQLNDPKFAAAIKTLSKGIFGLGIDLTSLLSPESQEFEKLSNDFLKSIKDVFGARISNLEVENFLKTVPNLSQSNQGKLAVIENLRNMNEATKVRKDAVKVLIDKYGSKLPFDFEEQVEEIAKPQLDEIAERFKILSKPRKEVPGTLGSKAKGAAGGLAGGFAGARLGASAGRIGGVPGAIGGAALGGLAGLSGLI